MLIRPWVVTFVLICRDWRIYCDFHQKQTASSIGEDLYVNKDRSVPVLYTLSLASTLKDE